MKRKLFVTAFVLSALSAGYSTANAQDERTTATPGAELTGDVRSACEAILCLSSGTRPGACAPSLSQYFGIVKKKFSDTMNARRDFLDLCPVASQTPEMQTLVQAISRGAGRCDVKALNRALGRYGDDGKMYIASSMPGYCAAYTGHGYTDFDTSGTMPKYVGLTERQGYWVEAQNYNEALAEYTARIEAEDRAAEGRDYYWHSMAGTKK